MPTFRRIQNYAVIIYSAVLLALSRCLCYILNNGGRIHPATRRAIDDLGGNDGTVR